MSLDRSRLDEVFVECDSSAMRFPSLLFFGALVASSASAGTVASLSFVGANAPEEAVANGVAALGVGGFVLYRHGQWTAQAPMAASEAAAALAETSRTMVAKIVQAPAPLLVDDCGARSIPWRSGLSTRAILGRAAYWPIVRDAECRHGLPGGLLDALVLQESRYQPAAVSRAGAGGLAQLMPATAADLGVRNRFDPVANVEAGARYLRSMLNRYNSVPLALAAYNAGGGAVDRAGGIPINSETPGYVRRVLEFWNQAPSMSAGMSMSRAVGFSFIGSSRV
jgi:soluble lytic murein transglycosylase-like protein